MVPTPTASVAAHTRADVVAIDKPGGRAYAPPAVPPWSDRACHESAEEPLGQMRLANFPIAAAKLRMGVPVGASVAGHLCPSVT
jgi:hypothetical protein